MAFNCIFSFPHVSPWQRAGKEELRAIREAFLAQRRNLHTAKLFAIVQRAPCCLFGTWKIDPYCEIFTEKNQS